MIYKAEYAKEITPILMLEHDIEDYIVGEKGEWVQWLVQMLEMPNLSQVWIETTGDRITGYMVLMDVAYLPLSDSVVIFYHWPETPVDEFVKQAVIWASALGRTLRVRTKDPRLWDGFGFSIEPIKELKCLS